MSTPINELFVVPAAPPKPSSEVEEVEEVEETETRPAKRARDDLLAARVESVCARSTRLENRVIWLETKVARLDERVALDPVAPSTEVGWRSVMMTEIWQTLAGGPVSNQLTRAELSALWKIAGTMRVAENRRALAFNAIGGGRISVLRADQACGGCDLGREYEGSGALCGYCRETVSELELIVGSFAEARTKLHCLPARVLNRVERFIARPHFLWVNLGTLVPSRS